MAGQCDNLPGDPGPLFAPSRLFGHVRRSGATPQSRVRFTGRSLQRVADLLRGGDFGDGQVHRAAIAAWRETMQLAALRAAPRIERLDAAVGRDGENPQRADPTADIYPRWR